MTADRRTEAMRYAVLFSLFGLYLLAQAALIGGWAWLLAWLCGPLLRIFRVRKRRMGRVREAHAPVTRA